MSTGNDIYLFTLCYTAVHGSCTHTLREDKPWIRVDLEPKYSETQVEAVIIYNRDDCCCELKTTTIIASFSLKILKSNLKSYIHLILRFQRFEHIFLTLKPSRRRPSGIDINFRTVERRQLDFVLFELLHF